MSKTRLGRVAIVGFGTMGVGLSQLLAQKGFDVRAVDLDEGALERGRASLSKGRFGLDRMLKDGKVTQEEARAVIARIETGTDMGWALEGAGIVIENIYEDLELKKSLFQKLDEACPKDVVLASDTSSLSITSMASKTRYPERVIGMHFFVPAQVMPLVEIINGVMTSKDATRTIEELSRELGKVTIISADRPGFVVARLSLRSFVEASLIVEQGIASVKDVDVGVRQGLGYPMGPFELTDLIGLDTRLQILDAVFEATGDPSWKPPTLLRQLVESGYLGNPATKKGSKGGYYEYFGLK